MKEPPKKKKKSRLRSILSSILLPLIFLVGLGVLAYPKISDWWNSMHSSRAIIAYSEAVQGMSEEESQALLAKAYDYNQRLNERSNPYLLPEDMEEEYYSLLDVGGNGVMGYVEIPLAGISLPVYHGTDEAILQIAVGHLDWTSLPSGGESTHCVISGHRGLPSAELFTKVDRLVEGDRFMFYVLNEILTYEVDQILIVLPEEVSPLTVSPGKDYMTLTTCTPYGINTHRLLIRGHRVETEYENNVWVASEAIQIEPVVVSAVLAAPLLVLLFTAMFVTDRKQWSEKVEAEEE